jgi:hypothetical protein
MAFIFVFITSLFNLSDFRAKAMKLQTGFASLTIQTHFATLGVW